MEALRLPEEIAVVHIKGHQKRMAIDIRGNNLANREAKNATENGEERVMIVLTSKDKESAIPRFSEQEEETLGEIGAEKNDAGIWRLPDGRQMLNRPLTKELLDRIQQKTHWGTRALCDEFLKNYGCVEVLGIAKHITGKCGVCQKVNKKAMRKVTLGGQELPLNPFKVYKWTSLNFPRSSHGNIYWW